jgi:hypothetical protein
VYLVKTYVPHCEQGERPGREPGGHRRGPALGAPRPDVLEARERRGRADHAGDHREEDEEPGRRVADREADRGELRRQRQPGTCIFALAARLKLGISTCGTL